MKDKENAFGEFIDMIKKSWTYDRMTETEKAHCIDALHQAAIYDKIDRGSYLQRWQNFNAVYTGFLWALGYSENPVTWRETDADAPQF